MIPVQILDDMNEFLEMVPKAVMFDYMQEDKYFSLCTVPINYSMMGARIFFVLVAD
jgi:hypothetical protein